MRVNGRTQQRGEGAVQRRREDGDKRNAAWRALTPDEQFRSLLGRQGRSKRQMKKLGHSKTWEGTVPHAPEA